MSVDQISNGAPLLPLKIEKLHEVISKEDRQKKLEKQEKSEKSTSSEEISSKKIGEVVEEANRFLNITKTHLQFQVREGLNKYYVEIRDSVTDEVIREIPPKKLIDILTNLQELAGLIVDETI